MEARRHAPSGIAPLGAPPLRIARPALLVGAASLASRVLGFVRDMLMAWLLGGGPAADALVVALRLPHVLRRLLGEGSLSMTLTACLVRYRQQPAGQTGPEASPQSAVLRQTTLSTTFPPNAFSPNAFSVHDQQGSTAHTPPPPCHAGIVQWDVFHAPSFALAWAITVRIALLLGLSIVVAEIAARPLIACIAPGLGTSASTVGTGATAATAEQAVTLFRICLPYAFAAGMAALGMAFLHSMGRFLLPALSPLCFNVVIIAFALLALLDVGSPATMLACGFLAGGLCQWLLPCVALWHMQAWSQRRPAPPPSEVTRCLRALPAGLLGAAAPQLAMLCAMAVASFLPAGSISALYYAERLLELPMSISGTALGMVSVPALTALALRQQHDIFASHCATAVRLSLLVALPAAAGLVAVAHPLISVLFGHGAFDQYAVRQTVLALSAYAFSLPLYALSRPLLAACTARKLERITALSGLLAMGVSLTTAAGLCWVLPPAYVVLGPPLAVGLALAAQSGLLWQALRAPLKGADTHLPLRLNMGLWGPPLYKILLATTLAFGVAHGATLLWPKPTSALLAGVGLGISVYCLSLLFLGHEDTKAFINWCKARRATPTTKAE